MRLKALGSPMRVRIMTLLLAVGKPVCVCEIADALSLPEYKVSRHLSALKAVGFVKGEHKGPWVYYEPVPSDLIEALRPFLSPHPDDLARLKERMKKRKGGVCVIGPRGGR
ncbi:MAG: Putative transcriptional regulator [Acetothermia bacterium 64_32]|nr:MAG: Putative transcriptional regulator [Acetothermia bacterium 64_32]